MTPLVRSHGLSGNLLKIIAAVSMLADHVGLLFFPQYPIFRIIGRISFPIFAFMIAEGCRYTRNRLRYFLTIFIMAVAYQVVYYVYDQSLYMSVLVTFSLSILAIYALDNFKETLFDPSRAVTLKLLSGLLFLATVAGIFALNRVFVINYKFWGCMLPVFASLFFAPKGVSISVLEQVDRVPVHVASLGIGLVSLALASDAIQWYALLSLPLLLLYSGKRGRWRMKYFFYVFYPAHLVILQGIYTLTH